MCNPQNLSVFGRAAIIVIVIEWLTSTYQIFQIVLQIVNSVQTQGGSGNSTVVENNSESQSSYTPFQSWLVLLLARQSVFFIFETCILGFAVTAMRKLQIYFMVNWFSLKLAVIIVSAGLSFYNTFVDPTTNFARTLGTPVSMIEVCEAWILVEYAVELSGQDERPQNQNIIVRIV